MESIIKFVTNNYVYRNKNHYKCSHVFKWGSRKDIKCGKISKYNDSLCHKHRYRYITSVEVIYKYIKNLFDANISNDNIDIIRDKKVIKNEIYVYNREMKEIYDNYGYFIYENNSESPYKYVNNLSGLYKLLIEYYKKDNIYKLFINILYELRENEQFNDIISLFFNSLVVPYLSYYIEEYKGIFSDHF